MGKAKFEGGMKARFMEVVGGSLLRIGREGDVETDETLEKRGEHYKNDKGERKMAYRYHERNQLSGSHLLRLRTSL